MVFGAPLRGAQRWEHLQSPLAEAYTATGLWRGVLVDSYLDDAAARHPHHTVVIDAGREVCFSELSAAVASMTAGLRRLGIGAGDVVSWMLPNWYEAIVVHHAIIRLGAVSNPIVPIYRQREVTFILRQARTKVLVVPKSFRGFDYPGMVADLDVPDLEHVVIVRGDLDGCVQFDALLNIDPREGAASSKVRSADDPVLLLYTSGTTADPKGAVHSHNTLDHELRSVVQLFGLVQHDTVFMPSPLTHVTGVLYGIHLPMLLGSTVVLQDVWDAAAAADLIQRHSASFTVGATPFLHGLVQQPDPVGGRLTTRAFACGGAEVPPKLIRDATQRLECCVVRVYGSTEHPTVSACGFADDIDKRASTDGRAVGATEIKIVDADDLEVAPNAVGEILVRGPEQFLGYLVSDSPGSHHARDGWFRTGDLGAVDNDGYISILGRKKDIIIRGGENLSVKEIEDLLLEHSQVADVAVVGMPDPILGERVCAFVVPGGDETPTFESLVAALRTRGVAAQKLPERVEVVDALPRTASGKIQKFILRERVQRTLNMESRTDTCCQPGE
jgi:cyclohexanecarboxylate-CoA ligase